MSSVLQLSRRLTALSNQLLKLSVEQQQQQQQQQLDKIINEPDSNNNGTRSTMEDDEREAEKTWNEVKGISRELDEIRTRLATHLQHIDSKDSITGADRYGPGTKVKMREAEAALAAAETDCQGLVTGLDLKMSAIEQRRGEASDKAVATALARQQQLDEEEERLLSLSSGVAATTPGEPVEQLIQEDVEITRQAESLRQKKADDVALARTAVLSKVAALNSLPLGEASLRTALSTLSAHHEYATARFTLLALLDGILARPDDEKLRRINPINPKIAAALTSLPGGLLALLALGFRLKIEFAASVEGLPSFLSPQITTTTTTAAETSVAVTDVGGGMMMVMGDAQLLSGMPSHYSLALELHEPDLSTSAGLARWTQWFDALKALREVVAGA